MDFSYLTPPPTVSAIVHPSTQIHIKSLTSNKSNSRSLLGGYFLMFLMTSSKSK